jgi:hypothetical protein
MLRTPRNSHKELYYPQSSASLLKRLFSSPKLSRPETVEELKQWITERESLFEPKLRELLATLAELYAKRKKNPLSWEGVENIPSEGPVIIAINHPEAASPVYFGVPGLVARPDLIAIAKRELEEQGPYLLRRAFLQIGISIDRNNGQDIATKYLMTQLLQRDRAILVAPEGGTDLYTQNFGVLTEGVRTTVRRARSHKGESVSVVPANIDSNHHINFYEAMKASEFTHGYPDEFVKKIFPSTQYPVFGTKSWNIIKEVKNNLVRDPTQKLSGYALNKLVEQVYICMDQSSIDASEQIKILNLLSESNPRRVKFLWERLDESHK